MTKLLILVCFICVFQNASAQYPFEKYPQLKLAAYDNWKTSDKKDRIHSTSTISNFFSNGDEITIKLTSYKKNWEKNSSIQIFENKKQLIQMHEEIAFNPTALDSVRIGDVNNDGLKDVKLVFSHMTNGLGLGCRVIYLLQKPNLTFTKLSFNDMMDYRKDRRERDFDGDGNYEIITMNLRGYNGHNYWIFNLYNILNYKLVNVNHKDNYPIMIQFLNKENFEITKNLSREKMKIFTATIPEDYSAN